VTLVSEALRYLSALFAVEKNHTVYVDIYIYTYTGIYLIFYVYS